MSPREPSARQGLSHLVGTDQLAFDWPGKKEEVSTTMPHTGTVFLVGGGPGDPGLITRRAAECLARADLVLYDALIHTKLLEFCRRDASVEFVGKRAGRAAARQDAIHRKLLEGARAGLTVVRLKGGDPYLFGRGSEEAEYLSAHGIAFEVVPGVPSPLAATSYAGISLSHRDLASSIAYVTATESPTKDRSAHDWSKLATATQTLVIFMGLRKLKSLMQTLIEHGRDPACPAAVIQSASLPVQRTVTGTVATIAERAGEAGIGMPALTVVGDVVTLRSQLRWYDRKPLFGKRVLVTRAEGQSVSLVDALRYAGAEALAFPTIRIAAPDDPAPLCNAVEHVGDYDWVVFTSVNGVERFFDELDRQQGDSRRLGPVRIASIGPATAAALQVRGLRPDVTPQEFRGERVAEAMVALHHGSMNGQTVLLPRAAVARSALPDALREAGARVDVVPAYQSLPPDAATCEALRATLSAGELDIATFTSPSTVQNAVAAIGAGAADRINALTVAVIGPVTRDAAQKLGIRVDVMPERYTIDGLLARLEEHVGETS
ncbi:MAG: uroporphyrinogen-III C-methyltransferase [Myxococcales bacterium]|nr:uroporphyrinogen-III C-methyltransferase [Myxococcales bacterium]